MTTITRHPVPADSYDPKRPLNDLLVAQFDHFKHIATTLPAELTAGIPPVPAVEDSEAVGRFIAALTKAHVGRKRALPRIVPKAGRKKLPATLALAASAEETPVRPKKSPNKGASKNKSSAAKPSRSS